MSKSIVKNSAFNVAYKCLNVIFPLITVSYASRILGADGIGAVSAAQNIATYFVMFATLGIPTYGTKILSKNRNNSEEINKTVSELFILSILATTLSTMLYYILIFYSGFLGGKQQSLYLVFGTLILINVFNIDWIYQAYEEYRYIALRSFVIKLISVVLLIAFVHEKEDTFLYAAIVCFGTVGNYFLNVVRLNNYVKLRFHGLSFKQHIKPIFILFGSTVAIEIYSLLDITMLSYFSTDTNIGYYSNASKIVKILANTYAGIGNVMLPRLSFLYAEEKAEEAKKLAQSFFDATIAIALPSMAGLILTSQYFVPLLFGNDFIPAIITLRILCPLVLFISLSAGIFGVLIVTQNYEIEFLKCVLSGTILNIVLNAIFIPLIKENGAALASAITEGIVVLLMMFNCIKRRQFSVNIKSMIQVIVSTIGMSVAIYIFNRIIVINNNLIMLCCDAFLGIMFYAIILLVLGNKFAKFIIINCIKKLHIKYKS